MKDWDAEIQRQLQEAEEEMENAKEVYQCNVKRYADLLKSASCEHDWSDKDSILDMATNSYVEYNICTKCGFEQIPG